MTATDTPAVTRTDLPLPGRRQGKVRDIYEVPAEGSAPPRVLIIATDRVSAFDVVLPTPIPGKGCMLTAIAARWFDFVRDRGFIADHLLSLDPADVPGLNDEQRASLKGRMMLGRAAEVIPIEFVVRGYLTGSGWKDYGKTGAVCGVKLPAGMERCGKIPNPIFTPATKATEGHDENIDFERASALVGEDVMTTLRDVSIDLYTQAAEFALERGIILADTKFEFGYALEPDGTRSDEIMLIDEILTPDSSRFWPAEDYEPGREQESFDKQFVRNFLEEIVAAGNWDKTPPGPELPAAVVEQTLERYDEAYRRLFG